MTNLLLKLLSIPLRLLPAGRLAQIINLLLMARARSLDGRQAMVFLFNVHSRVETAINMTAVRYGGGVHPKHRLMRYHDFFTDRISAGERVVDIGCGNGFLSWSIATKCGASVLGLEIVPANLEIARSRHAHPSIEFRQSDVLKDTLPSGFDVVVMSNVLEHLPDRVNLLRRFAAETGARRFLIRVPMFDRDWTVPMKQELGLDWRCDPTHETEYTLESFDREMDAAGLVCRERIVIWGEVWAVLDVSGQATGG